MKINQLKAYLSKFDTLLFSEIDTIAARFEFLKIKKDSFFIEENKVCEKMGFILSGGVKAFSTDAQGHENITCFKFEESFITSYESFVNAKLSKKAYKRLKIVKY